MKKLINGNIFNGRHFTGDSVVYVEGDRITGLSASSDTQDQPETEVIDLNGGYLVPGFIDLHVMGGSGVYFSNEPTADAIERTAGAHLKRSEEHTSELQSLMRISYAVFCLKKKK